MKPKRLIIWALAGLLTFIAFGAASCEETGDQQQKQYNQIDKRAKNKKAYVPHNDVELNNYNKAQKLYDSPDTIQWCTTTWGNASAPIVTIPITGKLTSSSTSFFSPEGFVADTPGDGDSYKDQWGTTRSVDGLYHPNPPQYRYGFTPGDQYVDFFNMPTLCTTAMSKFQRQQTAVTTEIDPEAQRLTKEAEAALTKGDSKKAGDLLKQLGSTTAGG